MSSIAPSPTKSILINQLIFEGKLKLMFRGLVRMYLKKEMIDYIFKATKHKIDKTPMNSSFSSSSSQISHSKTITG